MRGLGVGGDDRALNYAERETRNYAFCFELVRRSGSRGWVGEGVEGGLNGCFVILRCLRIECKTMGG